MTAPASSSRWARLGKTSCAAVCVAWAGLALWNAGKALPPGMRIASVTRRMSEADVEFVAARDVPARAVATVDHAEQLIIVEQSPLPRALAQALLERQHARPHLKVVVVSDPRGELEGGTPAQYLTTLESAGVIVARVRLGRLRDPEPLYSSLWRLTLGWWDTPFDDPPDEITLKMRLRGKNHKRDERRLLVADDGAGNWLGLVESAAAGPALALRGGIARDIAASSLKVAQWSSDDDRLPAPPPPEALKAGAVDARWLTESAARNALLDALAGVRVGGPGGGLGGGPGGGSGGGSGGGRVGIIAGSLGDRSSVQALEATALRVPVQILLDPDDGDNRALADELGHAQGSLEVRWLGTPRTGSLAYVVNGADLWLSLGSTAFTRRDCGDFNLTANVELRLPQRAAAARALLADFDAAWRRGAPLERFAEHSTLAYWRYRISEAWGLD